MIKRLILFFTTSLLVMSNIPAQTVPTSYEVAKGIGDAKYKALLKANTPAKVRYVVLNKEQELNKLLAYENTIYVVDRTYDLKGKDLNVPKNSVLVFRNGNIENGTLQGEDTKYSFARNKKLGCNLTGQWERIAPIYTASELGLKANSQSAKDFNYSKLQAIVKNRLNVYFDGTYYVSFPKPLLLDYQIHLYGGKLLFSKYAFDVTNGGGIYANGVHFSSSKKGFSDDIVCGSREKHPSITTGTLTFLNCHFSCNRIVSLEFKYASPLKTNFGIHSLIVNNCRADQTAKFITLDAPFLNKCLFQGNIFTNFSHAPIYLAHNHSLRTHPKENNTNPWTEEIINASCDVIIDSNVFVGKEMQDPSYYCSALVIAKKCTFSNNYLKDIVNYSDKKAKGYTAYDAYLSCVDVDYKNNYVENMMSYAKDGASKPQNEIGKSKMNPLEPFGVKSSRRYVNNIFICDGKKYITKGADKSSIQTSIFCNVSPIDEYVWQNNSVIYPEIVLDGRHSSAKYGSFKLLNNYFECAEFTGYLLFSNSAYDCSEIEMHDNIFRTNRHSSIVLLNQLYDDKYKTFSHGSISIVDNTLINVTPITHYFVANQVVVKNNKVENASVDKNTYLSNYSGAKTPLSTRAMDSELTLDTKGLSKGTVHQSFSSTSSGKYFINVKDIPQKGIYYNYQVGTDHSFQIVCIQGGKTYTIDFSVQKGGVSYIYNGQKNNVRFGQTKPVFWNVGRGVTLKTNFEKGSPNRIVTTLIGHSGSEIKFGYVGK